MEAFSTPLQNKVFNRRTWTSREQLRVTILTWIERVSRRRPRRPFVVHRIGVRHELGLLAGGVTGNCHVFVQLTLPRVLRRVRRVRHDGLVDT